MTARALALYCLMTAYPPVLQERDQCREVVKLLRAKVEEVKAASQVKNDEYWEGEQAWREQRAADKIRRDAEWAVEKAERDVAYKARQAELAGEPFNREVREFFLMCKSSG